MCDGSVTTACACANVNRAPWAASRSRRGVAARPPYDPSASARSVSIVTIRTFWSAFGTIANALPRGHQMAAATTAHASTPPAKRRRPGVITTRYYLGANAFA